MTAARRESFSTYASQVKQKKLPRGGAAKSAASVEESCAATAKAGRGAQTRGMAGRGGSQGAKQGP